MADDRKKLEYRKESTRWGLIVRLDLESCVIMAICAYEGCKQGEGVGQLKTNR